MKTDTGGEVIFLIVLAVIVFVVLPPDSNSRETIKDSKEVSRITSPTYNIKNNKSDF